MAAFGLQSVKPRTRLKPLTPWTPHFFSLSLQSSRCDARNFTKPLKFLETVKMLLAAKAPAKFETWQLGTSDILECWLQKQRPRLAFGRLKLIAKEKSKTRAKLQVGGVPVSERFRELCRMRIAALPCTELLKQEVLDLVIWVHCARGPCSG